MRLTLALASLLLSGQMSLAEINVVASIKPVHSLVAMVMGDTGKPTLLVDGANSPHTYSLKPRDAEALEKADVVFWVGHELEAFLEKPLDALATRSKNVALMDSPSIIKLPLRDEGGFAGDAHDHDHGEHSADAHIWLDPENAKAMLASIAVILAEKDPTNATRYAANAEKAKAELDALTKEISASTAPAKGKGLIVFHDAYQYFEKRFGLEAKGAIALQPETPPGAKALKIIRNRLKADKIVCVFAEPQFDDKLVKVIIEGTGVRSGILDPLGSTFEAGPAHYSQTLKQLATSLTDCLVR